MDYNNFADLLQLYPTRNTLCAPAAPPSCTPSKYSLPEEILCGFVFEWAPKVKFSSIPMDYNLICVAFLEPDGTGIPVFRPIDEQEVIDGVKALKRSGRTVLVSIGGATDDVVLYQSDKSRFRGELEETIDKYGFMGVDIDLEGSSIEAADNAAVITEVVKAVRQDRVSRGEPFYITMAPEFNTLRGANAQYRPIVEGLEGCYDLIFPQYYNHGLDGIWSSELNMYLSSNDDYYKKEFLYLLTSAIVTGTSDFIRIPANKFCIGLPAAPTSAFSGYVSNPWAVQWALDRLADDGNRIRGLMTWSINQDMANGYQFRNWYSPIVYS
jgi:chitinase